jgi:O-antigen/teichoic acid export membrane protein
LIKEVRWLFLTAVVCYVYTSLDGSLLGYLHSLHELGLARPAGQLVSSLNQFFALVPLLLYPRLIQWNKVGADFLWERQKKLGWILALGSVPIALGAFVLAPFVFPLLYGREFAASAYPFVILLTSKLVVLVNGIFGWGLWAKGEDIVLLKIMSVVAIVSLSLNLVLIPKWGLLGSTFVNLASESLILVLTFHACRRLARITPVTL